MSLQICKCSINFLILLLFGLLTARVDCQNDEIIHKATSRIKNSNEDIIRWKNEISGFLKSNIYQCKYQTLMFNQFNNRSETASSTYSDLLVYFRYPGGNEVQSYRKLPNTLSAANEKILHILNCPRLLKWSNEQGDRWMLPTSHVGQNRSLCINLTKLLAAGNVVKLYDQYKIIQKVSYIVVG